MTGVRNENLQRVMTDGAHDFAHLERAVTARDTRQVRELLVHVDVTAASERIEAENGIVGRAGD